MAKVTKKDDSKLESGVFVFFRAGRWDARAKQDTDALGKKIPKAIIKASKSIVEDRSLLKALGKIRKECKKFIFYNSMPVAMDSTHWVPFEIPKGEKKTRILLIDEFLEKKEKEYYGVRDELISKMSNHPAN